MEYFVIMGSTKHQLAYLVKLNSNYPLSKFLNDFIAIKVFIGPNVANSFQVPFIEWR